MELDYGPWVSTHPMQVTFAKKAIRILPYGLQSGQITTDSFPAGRYVLSFEYASEGQPYAPVRIGTRYRMANGSVKQGGGVTFGSPGAGKWVKCMMPVNMPSEWFFVIVRPAKATNREHGIHLRGFKLTPANEYRWTPSPKNNFVSDVVGVDSRGSMIIDGEPFVPIGIQLDQKRQDYRPLAKAGFNLDMWATSQNQANRAYDAGMYYFLNFTNYVWRKSRWDYKNISGMVKKFNGILDSSAGDRCIGFYVDNEMYEDYEIIGEAIDAIRDKVSSERPIYSLQGSYGLAPVWSGNDWHDFTGTYIRGENSGGASPGPGGHRYLWHQPIQSAPVTFMQINHRDFPIDEILPYLQNGLASGISHYGDGKWMDVTEADWFDEFPEYVDMIKHAVRTSKPVFDEPGPLPPIDEPAPMPPVKPPKPSPDTDVWDGIHKYLGGMPGAAQKVHIKHFGDWDLYAERHRP